MTKPSGTGSINRLVAPHESLHHLVNMTGSNRNILKLTVAVHVRSPRIRKTVHRDRAKVVPEYIPTIRACCEGQSPWPLLLQGPAGTGKTCIALLLCDAVRGSVIYYTAAELTERIHLATYHDLRADDGVAAKPARVYPQEIWKSWSDANLAVLDDLGTREKATDTHYETVKRAIDVRTGRPLVLTTNLDLDMLAAVYDDRMASRCAGGTVLHIGGPDRRIGG